MREKYLGLVELLSPHLQVRSHVRIPRGYRLLDYLSERPQKLTS